MCYEYLDWVWQSAPQQTTPAGIAPIDALAGPIFQIIIHEAGHAVFDLLKIPIFGREEDDADQFSAYVMLKAGKDEARRLIAGAAYQLRLWQCSGRFRYYKGYSSICREKHLDANTRQIVIHWTERAPLVGSFFA